MTKEECIALLNRYAEYNGMGIPNLAGCREAMRTAAELLQRPSLPSNLDEAADCYKDTVTPEEVDDSEHAISYETYTGYQIADAFKAGAEWMSLQSTRTRLAVKSNTPEGKDAYEKVAKEMRASVAAKNYAEGIYCPILKHKNNTGLNCTAVEDAFLKGAEWMAGQGESHETEIVSRVTGNGLLPAVTCLVNKSYKEGDKVVVQIRKK